MDHNEKSSPQNSQNNPGKQDKQSNRHTARMSLILLAIWTAMMFFLYRPTQTAPEPTVDLSQVAAEVRAGQVQKITVEADTLHVKRTDGSEQISLKESLVSAPDVLGGLVDRG